LLTEMRLEEDDLDEFDERARARPLRGSQAGLKALALRHCSAGTPPGLEPPDWISIDRVPTTLCSKFNASDIQTSFHKQVSNDSGTTVTSTTSTKTRSSANAPSTDDWSPDESLVSPGPYPPGLGPEMPAMPNSPPRRMPRMPLARRSYPAVPRHSDLSSRPGAPIGLHYCEDSDDSVRKGHTTVLVEGLPRWYARQAWLNELSDAGFRAHRDFDGLRMPMDMRTGLNPGCCIMHFLDVATTRAFTASFNGRMLRDSTSATIAVRPYACLLKEKSGESASVRIAL